jgi:ATP-dependent Clp protease ATP-binding subunit ClpC
MTYTAPPEPKEIESEVQGLEKEKEEAIRSQDYEKAAKLRIKRWT